MNETRKLAEEISFQLLATKKHVDMDWLIEKLNKFKNQGTTTKGKFSSWDGSLNDNDCGDANEY